MKDRREDDIGFHRGFKLNKRWNEIETSHMAVETDVILVRKTAREEPPAKQFTYLKVKLESNRFSQVNELDPVCCNLNCILVVSRNCISRNSNNSH